MNIRPHRPFAALAAPLLAAAVLSACVVVPVDPRTGQPYPYPPSEPAHAVTYAAPAAPAPVPMTARLYPVNPQAGQAGLLTAVVVDQRAGRGTFTVNYQGDTLAGEATRVDGGYAAFGRIHQEVLGPAPRAFSGQRGIANGVGSRGAGVQCEYLITGPGIGTGACLFSDGARYQMHFGN